MILDNKKLFLNINQIKNNVDELLVDTFSTFGIRNVLLDYNVAEKNNLSKIKIVFVKDKIEVNENISSVASYFNSDIKMSSQEIALESLNSDIFPAREFSNFEKNKIRKYSDVPSGLSTLEFETNFLLPPDLNNETTIFYDLLFSANLEPDDRVNTLWGQLRQFYGYDNTEENFKFVLQALDNNNNLIDITDVFTLIGITVGYTIELEYKEILAMFKKHLENNLELDIYENFALQNINGIAVKGYDNTHVDDDENPNRKSHYTRDPYYWNNNESAYRGWSRFPNLNKAWGNFLLKELLYDPGNVGLELQSNTDIIETPWIHGGNAPDQVGDDKILQDRELRRFNLSYVPDSTRITYLSKNENKLENLELRASPVFTTPTRPTWIFKIDFTSDEHLYSNFVKQLLLDYVNYDSFDFALEKSYALTSYQHSWNENFTIKKEFSSIQKSESFNNIIDRIALIKGTNEINRYFNIDTHIAYKTTLGSGEKPVMRINISRKISPGDTSGDPSYLLNSNFMLMNISYPLTSVSPEITVYKEIVAASGNIDILRNPINLGQNLFLEDLLDQDMFFEINESAFGSYVEEPASPELSLNFELFYNGRVQNISYPVDIKGGMYLFNIPYFRDLMNDTESRNQFSSIAYKKNPDVDEINDNFDFDIIINKTVADQMSGDLLYGNNASIRNVDDETSPIFLEDLLFEITSIDYFFTVNGEEFKISKVDPIAKNFYVNINDFDLGDNYVYSNVLSKQSSTTLSNRNLSINRSDVLGARSIGQRSDIKNKILEIFFDNKRNNLQYTDFSDTLSYTIGVKYRFFIFPKGLNKRFEIPGDFSEGTWDNIHEKIPGVTLDIKAGLLRQFKYCKPSSPSETRRDLAYKWITRYDNSNALNSKVALVKNFFYGAPHISGDAGNYVRSNNALDKITFSGENTGILASNFGNNNIDSELYDWRFYNTTLQHGSVNATTNLVAHISTQTRSSGGRYENFPELNIRSTDGRANHEIIIRSSEVYFGYNRSFTPKSISIAFHPEILYYRYTNRTTLSRLDNYFYLNKYGSATLKVPFISSNLSWNTTSANMEANDRVIRITINPGSTNYRHFFYHSNFFNQDSTNSIHKRVRFDNSDQSLLTNNIIDHTLLNQFFKTGDTKPDLTLVPNPIRSTFITSGFMYRIKIDMEDGNSLYTNVSIPFSFGPKISEVIEQDQTRFTIEKLLKNGRNLNADTTDEEVESILSGKLMKHVNMSCMPYQTLKSRGKLSNIYYRKIEIKNIPGYTIT